MRRLIFIFLIVMCFTSFLFAELDFCDRTVLVVLTPAFSEYAGSRNAEFFGNFEKESVENIFQIHNEAAIRALNERSSGEFRSIYKITLPTNDKAKVLSAIEELKTIEGIESASPDYITSTTLVPNDEYWNHPGLWALWGTHGVKGPEAWDIATGSHSVRVGISDTGIASHPDLNANLDVTTGWNFASNNSNTTDTHSHGTRSAGIVGAVGNNVIGTVGINWDVTLVPLRISVDGYSNESVMTAAVTYATNLWGTADEIPIVTMSFSGYGQLTGLRSAINNFPGLFVWSAGNHGGNVDTYAQIASFNLPNLISVGAIDVNGERSVWGGGQSSAYSSSGEHVHVFAPGTDGYTTGLNNGYQNYGGTSMAAPHAAGVAALLLSVNPMLSAAELKQLIVNNYDPITISTPAGSQVVKRLNAFKPAQLIAYDYDLAASSLTGPNSMSQNSPATFVINVRNNGKMPAIGYTVQLKQVGNDTPLASTAGLYILQGASYNYTLEWTPDNTGQIELYGEIVWAWDENPANNTTSRHFFSIHPEGVFEVFVGNPTSTFGRRDSFINYFQPDSVTQTIYLESELIPGTIQQMSVRFTGTPNLVPPDVDVTIYLATTNKSQFSGISDWVPYENFVEVFHGALPVASAGTYAVDIYFDTPFQYGGENLVVMAVKDHVTGYGADNLFQFTHLLGQYRTLFWAANNLNLPPFPSAHGLIEGITNANFIILSGLAAPINLVATSGNGFVNLTWMPPTLGTEDLIGYQVYRDGVSITEMSTNLSYTDTDVTNGMIYSYFVRAYYQPLELSPPSNTVHGYPDNILSPSSVSLSLEGSNVLVTWTMPATRNQTEEEADMGRAFLGFSIYRDGVKITQSTVQGPSYVDNNNLTPDNQYTYGVSAVYHRGESDIISNSIIVPMFSPPQNLSAVGNVEAVNLSWSAPQTQNYGNIAGYIINRDEIDLNNAQNLVTNLFYDDTDVIAGQNFIYRIKTVYTGQINGESVYTEPAEATPLDNIVAPSIINTQIVENDIIVSWEHPNYLMNLSMYSQRGRAFHYFELEKNNLPLTTTSDLTFIDTNPEHDVSYIYRVRTVYDTGYSDWVESSQTHIQKYNPVRELQTNVVQTGILLTWAEPEIQNHGIVLGYKIIRGSATLDTVNNLLFLDTEVSYDTSYTYEVIALYDVPDGQSIPMSSQNSTPPAYPISNPNAEHIENGVLLTWTAPNPDLGTISGYSIYKNGTFLMHVTTTNCKDDDVSSGQFLYSIVTQYEQPTGESVAITVEIELSEGGDVAPPLTTRLLGNYPNPFNPETTINFVLSKDGIVEIDIYNIRGLLIRTLMHHHLDKGNHSAIWNGLDNHGQKVGSGVYFYQMKTGEYTAIKRMLLLK